MANLLPNIEKFLSEIQKTYQFESFSESNGILMIKLKKGCFNDPNTAIPFLDFISSLKDKLKLGAYIKQVRTTQGNEYYYIDVATLHADRLREFFHKDISQADAAASIDYLQKVGWIESQFLDLGMSRPTFYRYQIKQKKSQVKTTSVSPEQTGSD